MSYRDFSGFSVWQNSFDLLTHIYNETKKFPEDEKYGITSDIRRAANSVVHNIAEGYGRFERRDKTRFYKISRGSAYEIMSQIMVCQKIGYLDSNEGENFIEGYENIIKELNMLIKTIENMH